jgi:hypothetical protein
MIHPQTLLKESKLVPQTTGVLQVQLLLQNLSAYHSHHCPEIVWVDPDPQHITRQPLLPAKVVQPARDRPHPRGPICGYRGHILNLI